MTYEQALSYIHDTLKFGSRPGLERISRLLDAMGNPQKGLKLIHVAGTNGKGSVCQAISRVLTAAGYRTGLYISPYVVDFRERIQIDAQMIPHGELAEEVEQIRPFVRKVAEEFENPTEFEIITALAFDYFRRKRCDAVVLEVGLGGRFDATNVIDAPLASVITSISYDHTAILGDTLGKIAFEKCGILKQGAPAVTSPGQAAEALEPIRRISAQRGCGLSIPDLSEAEVLSESLKGTRVRYHGREWFLPLCGRHQIGNFLTAYETVRVLREGGLPIPESAVAEGFANARMPARLETLSESPLILLDGGHNPGAAQVLKEVLDRFLAGRKIAAVMGICADKDVETVVGLLAPRFCSVAAVRPDNPRGLKPAALAEIASRSCPKAAAFESYAEAFESALADAGPEGAVLICGSFYLAGPVRGLVMEHLKKVKI